MAHGIGQQARDTKSDLNVTLKVKQEAFTSDPTGWRGSNSGRRRLRRHPHIGIRSDQLAVTLEAQLERGNADAAHLGNGVSHSVICQPPPDTLGDLLSRPVGRR